MQAPQEENQDKIKELLEYADEQTLRMIYAYLAPVELSISTEQNEALNEIRQDDDENNDLWRYGLFA